MKEIDNIFIDVRNAFRVLNDYQKRVLQIVNYVREQTPYTDMWGSKDWYSNEIGKRRNSPDPDYAKLSVDADMWGWDFLYGYFFEYYFGKERIEKKSVEMSLFQVSDDGYFVSNDEKRHMTNTSSFALSEISHSFIVFKISVYTSKESKLWLRNSKEDDDCKRFLTDFLSSTNDIKIVRDDSECCIIKKYEMQRFSSQHEADEVIRDFGKIVKDNTGIKLFKNSFYE